MKRKLAVDAPPTPVYITMLRNFTIRVGTETLSDDMNRSQKMWNVLAYLITHRNRNVPQSELLEQFWPDDRSASPASALKTLLYRIRAMLEPLFPEGVYPIVSQRGAYAWNRGIAVHLDVDELELLCTQACAPGVSNEARLDLYGGIAKIYKGSFLPKLAGSLWVLAASARYQNLYQEAAVAYAKLLALEGRYEEIGTLCQRALEIDPLHEEMHVAMVSALLYQGKNQAALKQYETAVEILYRSLGVGPSEELQTLYRAIMDVEQGLETDLSVIQEQLRETAERPGAFLCEYGFFREIYRLEARRCARSKSCIHVALITLAPPEGGMPPLRVLTTTMEWLMDVLVVSLRRGDVAAKYSACQYVVMLPGANFEDSSMVMERVTNAFHRQHRHTVLKLTTKIRQLEIQ